MKSCNLPGVYVYMCKPTMVGTWGTAKIFCRYLGIFLTKHYDDVVGNLSSQHCLAILYCSDMLFMKIFKLRLQLPQFVSYVETVLRYPHRMFIQKVVFSKHVHRGTLLMQCFKDSLFDIP